MSQNPKILIVDDEPLNVKLFAASLSSEGYKIVTASNGEQALIKVFEESPDLIILDIMMPDIDGFEVTRKIKANSKTRNIPVILITASDDPNYKAIGIEAGADEFLNKPIKPIEIKSRTKSLLETKIYRDRLAFHQQHFDNNSKIKKHKHVDERIDKSSLIIVIESNDGAKCIKTCLQGQPYQIILKESPKETIELCSQHEIDLILVDAIFLEKEEGELFASLKEKEQTSNIQTLVISDPKYIEKKYEQFQFWIDDFLIKPINVHELRLRIRALLKKKTYFDAIYAGLRDYIPDTITDNLSGLAKYSYLKYYLWHEKKKYM